MKRKKVTTEFSIRTRSSGSSTRAGSSNETHNASSSLSTTSGSTRPQRESGTGKKGVEPEPNVTLSQYSQLSDERDTNYLLQFVIPNGRTKANCPQKLLSAFVLCQQYNLSCVWVNEKDICNIIPMPGNIFVLDAFEGVAFKHLDEELRKSKNFMVIGPQCLQFSLQRNELDTAIIQRGFPMFTLGMRGLVISLSGFKSRTVKHEIMDLIRKMGGFPAVEFTLATTHIVTESVLTQKCEYAYAKGISVMTVPWVREIWTKSLDTISHATDPEFVQFECPILYKLEFCFSQVPLRLKTELQNIITTCGGGYSAQLVKGKTNILIIPKAEGEKFRAAYSWDLPCLLPEWIFACKVAGHVVSMDEFRVGSEEQEDPDPVTSTPAESRLDARLPESVPSCSVIQNATRSESSLDSPRPTGPPLALASSQTPQSQANDTPRRKSCRTPAAAADLTYDDCGSTDIDTSSDSPLYLGLPRKQSRILKKAFKIGCPGSPNTTIEEMKVRIPVKLPPQMRRRRSSTPIDDVIRQNLLAFAEKYGEKDEMEPIENEVEPGKGAAAVADPLHSWNGPGPGPTKSSSNRPHPVSTSTSTTRTTSPNENVPSGSSRKRGSATTSSEEELEAQANVGMSTRKKCRTVVVDSLFGAIAGSDDKSPSPTKESSASTESGSGSGSSSKEPVTTPGKSSEEELSTVDSTSTPSKQSASDEVDEMDPRLSASLLRSAERKEREKRRLSQLKWTEGRRRTNPLTFMFTGLSEEEKSRYGRLIEALGGRVNQESRFTSNIDAVIAGSLARSEKVLCAMAFGKRILRPSYITSSRSEGSFLPDPDGYLWGYGHGKNPGEELMAVACAYWFHRIKTDPREKPFTRFRALILDHNATKAAAYKNLIIAGGGEVFESTQLDKINVLICDSNATLAAAMGPDFTLPPGVVRKLPVCLHEIIIKCSPPDDEFFIPSA